MLLAATATRSLALALLLALPYHRPVEPRSGPHVEAEAEAGAAKAGAMRRICRVTAYCDRGTTASGVESGVGQCAAPIDIPFGSRIHIPELDRTFLVTDRTARRFRHNTVDIFIPTREACLQFGRQYLICEVLPPLE